MDINFSEQLATFDSNEAGYLTKQTMKLLQDFFSQNEHKPSQEMWHGLLDLASTMELMVKDNGELKYYLSSLDPGVGKTQTISKFCKVLLSIPTYREVGVIIFVNQLSQIKGIVEDLDIPTECLAVLTSDQEINKLGTQGVSKAQVLITTQQRAERLLYGQSFRDVKVFHYLGRPRLVRIWDETFLPGQPIALDASNIGYLLPPLARLSEDLSDFVITLLKELKQLTDGETYTLPDFVLEYGIGLNDILEIIEEKESKSIKDKQSQIATILWHLSGRTVKIRNEGKLGERVNIVVDYRDIYPSDLAPMLILDASGRCRSTYEDIEQERRSLIRLRTATKKYDNLSIHVWQKGGSKDAWRKDGTTLTEGIIRTINQKPEGDWLVVVHQRAWKIGDIENQIKKGLSGDPAKVAFINWGDHMATNKYATVPNLVLAGTLFYRPSDYEALKRLAADRRVEDGDVTQDEIRKITIGEHKHHILQALCRGRVRKCDGENCHPMNAYIIAAANNGIKEELPSLFPGCSVENWSPNPLPLKGKVKAAIDYLANWSKESQDTTIKFKIVSEAIDMKSPDFSKSIRQHPAFKEALVSLGLYEDGCGERMTVFARKGLLQ